MASPSTASARAFMRGVGARVVGEVGGAGGVDRQVVALADLSGSGVMASSALASPIQARGILAVRDDGAREAARGGAGVRSHQLFGGEP